MTQKSYNLKSRGILITFEGADFSGKTTILNSLTQKMAALFIANPYWNGYTGFVCTFEPGGGSLVAEKIRELILYPPNKNRLNVLTETFLFAAARNENVQNLILPSIMAKKIVFSDRFVDSSLVYQGLMSHLGLEKVKAINNHVLTNLTIDATFYFAIDLTTWKQRSQKRTNKNILDDLAHLDLVTKYDQLIQQQPERNFFTIDGTQKIDDIVEEIISIIQKINPEN